MTPAPAERGDLAHVEIAARDGVTVATVTGEIDISNVGAIAEALTRLPNLALGLVVDLTAVVYLDSTGVSLLHDLALRLRRRSQRLLVVCPRNCPPRRTLELTGLPSHSELIDELDAALAQLAGSP
jgi:anti-anti-sigma factor